MKTTRFDARTRFNWGYWDGRHDRDQGKYAPWLNPTHSNQHPDKIYGQGYWAGRYDPDSPDTSTPAWKNRRKLNAAPWMP